MAAFSPESEIGSDPCMAGFGGSDRLRSRLCIPLKPIESNSPMVLSEQDRDLLNRCLAKVDGAWDSFIDRYLPLLTHVVSSTLETKFGRVPVTAKEDLLAEVLLALVEDDYAILRRFKGQSSLGTYLVVIARRISARRVTKMAKTQNRSLNGQKVAGQNAESAAFENTEEVEALLSRMDSEDASLIRLFHLEHKSYQDIGLEMGIPENSIGPKLSRARDRMRSLRD
jgi:RNA polymerase sigma-70 factor (ECF subfamily)